MNHECVISLTQFLIMNDSLWLYRLSSGFNYRRLI